MITTLSHNLRAKTEELIKFIEPPRIVRVNKFSEEAVKLLNDDIQVASILEQPVIPVIIDSYGGECYSLLAMIDLFKNSTKPIATIIEGKAMSCGAILAGFGTVGYRFVANNATVMIHDVSCGAWGKVNEVKASAEQCEKLNAKIYKMLAQHCGHPPDYFLKKIDDKKHAEWYLTSDEVKKEKLCDFIRIPSFKMSVQSKIELV